MATTESLPTPAVPQNPADLSGEDYRAAFKRTLKEVKDDDVPGLASGVAFKMFLSLFPSLFAAVAIFSIVTTPGEIAEMIDQAGAFLPEKALEFIVNPLQELANGDGTSAGFAALAGIAGGLFAATSAAISMMKALSRAYDVPETRKFVKQRLVGLALTIALLAALIAVALLLIVGRQLQESLLGNLPQPLDWLLVAVRFVLALAVLTALFAFIYWIGPNREHPSWVWMSPGSALAVIGWLVVAGGFTYYAQTLGDANYNKTYGAIAGVAILLVWLQLSMLVILVGAEFNAEIERRRRVHAAVSEGAGFAVPAASAAVGSPDPAGDAATLAQAEHDAPAVTDSAPAAVPDPGDPVVLDLAPAPVPSRVPPLAAAQPTSGATTSGARNAGFAAAATAIVALLGFARHRHRR